MDVTEETLDLFVCRWYFQPQTGWKWKKKFFQIFGIFEVSTKKRPLAGSAGPAGHRIGCSIKFGTCLIIIIWFFNAYITEKKSKKKKRQKKKKICLSNFFDSTFDHSTSSWPKNSPWQKKIFFLPRLQSLQSTPTCRELKGEQFHIWYVFDLRRLEG